jgi:dTMP kinase
MPDLNVIFDVDEATATKRLNPLLDRMEQKGGEFHRRVRAGYRLLVDNDPDRFLLIDASGDEDAVHRLAMDAIAANLSRRHSSATARP